MALIILFALLATPVAEIAAFIEVGGRIGVWPTLGLVVVTAIVGTALLRYQGLRTLYKVQETLNRGALPVDEVFDGFFLVIAGALLLTPGFITDAVGLLLFAPPVRAAIKSLIRRNMAVRAGAGRTRRGADHVHPPGPGAGQKTVIIEGDYIDVTANSESPAPPKDDEEPDSTNGGTDDGTKPPQP